MQNLILMAISWITTNIHIIRTKRNNPPIRNFEKVLLPGSPDRIYEEKQWKRNRLKFLDLLTSNVYLFSPLLPEPERERNLLVYIFIYLFMCTLFGYIYIFNYCSVWIWLWCLGCKELCRKFKKSLVKGLYSIINSLVLSYCLDIV